MFKIWAKLMRNEKIIKDTVLEIPIYDYINFTEYMQEIAYALDIPTPIILTSHIVNFTVYNNTKFTADDFIESINFERLVVSNATTE